MERKNNTFYTTFEDLYGLWDSNKHLIELQKKCKLKLIQITKI